MLPVKVGVGDFQKDELYKMGKALKGREGGKGARRLGKTSITHQVRETTHCPLPERRGNKIFATELNVINNTKTWKRARG